MPLADCLGYALRVWDEEANDWSQPTHSNIFSFQVPDAIRYLEGIGYEAGISISIERYDVDQSIVSAIDEEEDKFIALSRQQSRVAPPPPKKSPPKPLRKLSPEPATPPAPLLGGGRKSRSIRQRELFTA